MTFVAHGVETKVELTIIIVSYNTRELTLEALRSLFEHPPTAPFEIIVVDNNSPDGSADAIGSAYPGLRLIAHPENLGFAAANNLAALEARGRRLLLLNPDTISLPASHNALLSFADAEPHRGIWGARTLFPDMSHNPTHCWRRMSLWSLWCSATGLTHYFPRSAVFNPEFYPAWPPSKVDDVDIVTGCYLLIDADLWRRLGGFDPTFFMYAEEADLCLRARALGARPGVTGRSEIVHMGGMSEPTNTEKIIKTARGRITLMRKHWSPPAIVAGKALYLFWSWTRLVASSFIKGRRDKPGAARSKWVEVWRRRSEWLEGYPELNA